MLATAEQEVAALQKRYLSSAKGSIRQAVDSQATALTDILRYHLGWQDRNGNPSDEDAGKGLRPVLCLTACELAGGDWHRALPAAAALELIHNFSLVHDDVQDGDETRRGRATVWSIWGIPTAISAGNAMRVVADHALLGLRGTGVSAEVACSAAAELTVRYLEMIEGQYLDMDFEHRGGVSVDEYLDMVGRKTGALIESAMYMGALIATGERTAAERFGRCGRLLGLAFQARDDFLGVWGDPAATGKAVGADIRRKKKSLPVLHLFDTVSDADAAWLRRAYQPEEVAGDDVERVMALMDSAGTPAYVQEVAEAKAAEGVLAVRPLGLAAEATRKLEAMAEFFVTRIK